MPVIFPSSILFYLDVNNIIHGLLQRFRDSIPSWQHS